jgi:hypothetical protein
MRSVANFPTGGNRRRGRRIPDQGNNSNSTSWSQASPVWGRSAAAVVAISSSPSTSSFGSNDSMNMNMNNNDNNKSTSTSTSQSPVRFPQQSPVWGRSARATTSATRSPRWMRRNENNNDNNSKENHQQQRAVHNRSRSPSPMSSPISMDDHRDEVTTTTITSNYPSLQLQALSSRLQLPHLRQMPSHELCTIAEDRRISSNTLSQMTITSTAQQIARSPVLAKHSIPQPRQQQQQQQYQHHLARMHHSSPKFFDPYNDDSYDDPWDNDCASCWVYQKSEFRNWWLFGNHSNTSNSNGNSCDNNSNNSSNNNNNINHQHPSRSRTDGFPTGRRRIHVRRTSF